MGRKLTSHFLNALIKEFPWLEGWSPTLHRAEVPVTFKVAGKLDPNTTWSLRFGRHNNDVDRSYTKGICMIGLSDGQSIRWIDPDEGETKSEDVLQDGDKYVLVMYHYCSHLVRNDPGYQEWTLYKRVEQTLASIKDTVKKDAAQMRVELEAA